MSEDRGSDDCLEPGTELLHGQFTIETFLNSGGFGITYLARDSLDRRVVIKECFPTTMCWRAEGSVQARSKSHQAEFNAVVKHFAQEGRRLAKLSHPNIVGVHQVFEDRGTSFLSLDYVEGRDLLHVIKQEPDRLSPPAMVAMTHKLLDAIEHVHEQGILHRDISPDNVLLTAASEPVLIDFGAARDNTLQASRVLSAISVVKDGYSPQEFYLAGTEQAPASDLYALGATLHHILTGVAPPVSQVRLAALAERLPDPYCPLVGRVSGYEPGFLAAIDMSLRIFLKDRLQSVQDWRAMMDPALPRTVPAPKASTGNDADITSAILQLVEETNVAVEAAVQRDQKLAEEEALRQIQAQQEADRRRRKILEDAKRDAEEAASRAARKQKTGSAAGAQLHDNSAKRGWFHRLLRRSPPPASSDIAIAEGIDP